MRRPVHENLETLRVRRGPKYPKTQIVVRLPDDLVGFLDAEAARLKRAYPDMHPTRSDALRLHLRRAMRAAEEAAEAKTRAEG